MGPQFYKPNPFGYERFMHVVRDKVGSDAMEFTYVGDNLLKDFIYPNKLGWNTVCLLDDGRNVHKQEFDAVPDYALPKRTIKFFGELCDF